MIAGSSLKGEESEVLLQALEAAVLHPLRPGVNGR